MNQINPFFLIGTFGMLITSILHIFLGIIISEEAAANSLWILYPVFAVFIVIGTIKMMKRKSPLKE